MSGSRQSGGDGVQHRVQYENDQREVCFGVKKRKTDYGAIVNEYDNVYSIEKPKRPMSAFLLWLNSARNKIKAENPGLKLTDVVRKGGEIWRSLKQDEKGVWIEKANKAREKYLKDVNDLKSRKRSYGRMMSDEESEYQCRPKMPMSAYMMWLNSVREQIKAEYPGLRVTEIAKKGGDMWRSMKDKSVWEKKAELARQKYKEEKETYQNNRNRLYYSRTSNYFL